MFLCAFFAFLMTGVAPCFASADNPTNTSYFSNNETYTYYDTVTVVDCATVRYLQRVEYFNNSYEMQTIGYRIIAVFSNGMTYEHYVTTENISKEIQEKGLNYVSNIKKGDVVIVKVELTVKGVRIVDFVSDLSLR